jgi:hypothetical protein
MQNMRTWCSNTNIEEKTKRYKKEMKFLQKLEIKIC